MALRPLITRSRIAMIAITSSTWIMLPMPKLANPNRPTAQIKMRTTAIIYRRLPMAVRYEREVRIVREVSGGLYGGLIQKDLIFYHFF